MKNLRIPTPVKYVLVIFAVVFAVFVYSFWGSKLESQNKDIRTPEAYGLDSLEYQAEPVMEIRVWQRNDKTQSDYPERKLNESVFYSILTLPLEAGASLDTVWQPFTGHEQAVLEVLYDGNIRGFYDIPASNMVDYTGETTLVPSYGVTGADVRRSEDGTFEGNKKMTLRVSNMTLLLQESFDPLVNAEASGVTRSFLQSMENSYGFLFKDYYYLEYYRDVYPDAPVQDQKYKNLKQLKRVVTTNYLTIQAMHPTKQEIPVATAVLEIRQYSSWFGVSLLDLNKSEKTFMQEHCTSNDFYNDCYGTVTVVSYEQSDSFSME